MKNIIKYGGLFTMIFIFIVGMKYFLNILKFSLSNILINRNSISADIFDSQDSVTDVIFDGEPSRVLQPTLIFYPENSVVFDKCSEYGNYCDYYTLNVPSDIIEIGVDNITSNPHCPYGWRYKFQGYSKYFKIGDHVTDADISYLDSNYPVVSPQDGINKVYKVDGNQITVYFDKNIKNAQYFGFLLNDNIKVYKNYKTGELATINSTSINGNEIIIILDNVFEEDYGRIVINSNMISDIDGRIASNDIVVGDEINNLDGITEYIIDNLRPTAVSGFKLSGNSIIITFSEYIFAAEGINLYENISDQGGSLISHPSITDIDIEGNELRLFFSSSPNITSISIAPNTIVDKSGNGNAQIN